jgi:hypothetical protein
MVGFFNKIAGTFRSWRLDSNEKKFIRDSPFLDNSKLSSRKRVILIQMPMDYFYVSLFSLVGQQLSQQFNGQRIGLWPHNIVPFPRPENITAFGRIVWSFLKTISQLLEKKKWSKVYRGIGIVGDIGLDQVSSLEKMQNERAAHRIWSSLKSKRQLIDLVLNGVHCGDLIYDTYIRFRARPTVKLDDPYLEYLIEQCLNAQLRIRTFLAEQNVAVLLSSYSSYIQHGVPVREALRSGVTVYTAGTVAQYLNKADIKNALHVANYQDYASTFAALNDKAGKLALAKRQLEERFVGHIDGAIHYMQASAYADTNDHIPDGIEGVVFLHEFFDSPHACRWMLFEDFWEWAVFTLRVIQENDLHIAVKPHPNQLPESIEVVKKLKEEFPRIIWLDANVSNRAIFQMGIQCGISVYGTVLHELAYHRIAPLAAGDHPHISFDIARTPSTVDEYEHLLVNFKTLRVSDDVQEEVLAFYYMNNIYDQEALKTEAPQLRLHELDADSSDSLIIYLEKIKELDSILSPNSSLHKGS